jgi:hypothetical protein
MRLKQRASILSGGPSNSMWYSFRGARQEGSTDSSILKKSLALLEPEVEDFFEFIDMKENYPFTGTGNVVNFCKGLAKIQTQRKVLIVLDNDTAGQEAYNRINEIDLPPDMKVVMLPNIRSRFRTLGPTGKSFENINGRAVSIECFLDLHFDVKDEPKVRWTTYNKFVGAYQGELVDKDEYVKIFLKKAGCDKNYDVSKLMHLWQYLTKFICGEFYRR